MPYHHYMPASEEKARNGCLKIFFYLIGVVLIIVTLVGIFS